jgi:hypothetical protein
MKGSRRPEATRAATGSEIRLFVSPGGNDAWSGRSADAGSGSGPFATLERARDELRALRAAGQDGPAAVTLGPGLYRRDSSLVLDERDGGSAEAPTTWRGERGQQPRLVGGVLLTVFRSVTDPGVLERLDDTAASRIVVADLRAHGITGFGTLRSRGYGRSAPASHLELAYNGEPMTLSRWPDNGYTLIADVPAQGAGKDPNGGTLGALEAGFHYDGDRPRRWAQNGDTWVHGYWAWDWANSYEQVDSIDLDARLVVTRPPHGHYGFRPGNRFYFLNILEELDTPGEYYVDRAAGLLYFYPPGPLAGAEVLASVLEAPVIAVQGASHLCLEGLAVESSRGPGITVTGGSGVRVAGCALRNIGTDAVVVSGGTGHAVESCDIEGAGDSGAILKGGDRAALAPAGHRAFNNVITRTGRWSRTYCPGIEARGVGITIDHNLIHHVPHNAILYHGNEILIEYNEIHHATLETGDAGATYAGRDFTCRGVTIRYNHIHDLGGYGVGTMGIYLDDCVGGHVIYGNLLVRMQRAVFLGGGRDISVENNIFVECWPAFELDARGLDRSPQWHDMVYGTMKPLLETVDYHSPPWCDRYPEMLALDTYLARDDGVPPENNLVARNICASGRWLYSGAWARGEPFYRFVDNLLTDSSPFWDPQQDDYTLKPGSAAFALGFRRLPVEQMGLVRNELRPLLPGERPTTDPS